MTFLFLVLLLVVFTIAAGFQTGTKRLHVSAIQRNVNKNSNQLTRVFAGENKDEKKRKIVKYDNVGDPIYEDELNASDGGTMNGMNILGFNVDLDPTSLTLLGFGLIAFQFFVLANINE